MTISANNLPVTMSHAEYAHLVQSLLLANDRAAQALTAGHSQDAQKLAQEQVRAPEAPDPEGSRIREEEGRQEPPPQRHPHDAAAPEKPDEPESDGRPQEGGKGGLIDLDA